ncbi:MAG: Mur ligase [Magnetococcales bacterium]|nr:Mur ligase [Magnetococcales bacterium]
MFEFSEFLRFTPCLTLLTFVFFAYRRTLVYLHIFQQEEYDGKRFIPWMLRTASYDRKVSFVLLLTGFFVPFVYPAAFFVAALTELNPKKNAKKTLVMTQRATRIFAVAFVLSILVGTVTYNAPWWGWIVAVQLITFTLVLGNLLLKPYEAHTQQKFLNEAKAKLKTLNPTIVGITGSFGKTSVKHMLGHVLSMQAPTLVTPGSVNTPMGITRIIREQLRQDHQFFVVEMGAYGKGSIERLCKLTPPAHGVLTALGHAHYERFKSLDMVAKTKFELAEAVKANKGQMIIHEQVLEQPYAKAFTIENRDNFTLCGVDADINDVVLKSAVQTAEGLKLDIRFEKKTYRIEAPLFGLHHAGNLAVVFATAVRLGVPADVVVTALKSVPQVAHRLEVKPQNDGTVLVDDAYNSNPKGFKAALELLPILQEACKGRAIVVTPGMVELGEAHDEEHTKIGVEIAKNADILLAVSPARIGSMLDAFKKARSDEQSYVVCQTFAEARDWLVKNKQQGDVVLLENDLPDLYEAKLNL